MQVISVVGARPQFVKVAPIDRECAERGVAHRILHTGQHYDEALSASFFRELEIADPAWNLSVGSGSHAAQTARMLEGCEEIFTSAQPDVVICYGDTNSTVAAALAAVKMHLPIVHIEAGLRSFNRAMPEEHNRVVTDHLCDVLFAPTDDAVTNLENEGLADRTVRVGDVMGDVIQWIRTSEPHDASDESAQDCIVATIHRAENTDDPERLRAIIDALDGVPMTVKLFAHPRLIDRCRAHSIDLDATSISVAPPSSYVSFMRSVRGARCVVTDSGGLQKEAYLLGVPCTTVRTETEWTTTLADGWNELAEPHELAASALRPRPSTPVDHHMFGDGRAAREIIDVIEAQFGQNQGSSQ